ncbi:hypothetical protein [Streptomyces sp. NPDC059753]|uniref:hypothetical protein n=1 Tax=Streptomyces sp. NPDC059753 TaxID=3346933 RepID=UPI0036541292
MIVHDLAEAYLTVVYAAVASAAIASVLVASAIVALAGAVTGMWARIDRRAEQPAAEYEEAA